MLNKEQAKQMLLSFKKRVDLAIEEVISSFEEENDLTRACTYALVGQGKRLRPIIVLMVADALQSKIDLMPAALSVEFFHTASLIADDLPCMDDESFRREKQALHKVFPESVSLLASYTLIALGYEYISKNAKGCNSSHNLCLVALEKASRVAGISGATNGQFLDLFPPKNSIHLIEKIIDQKTVTLFDLSFSLGWIFGGGNIENLHEVSSLASHFGKAFQIADDMQDFMQDDKEKNIVSILGADIAYDTFLQEVDFFKEKIKRLGVKTQAFDALILLLLHQMEKSKKLLV